APLDATQATKDTLDRAMADAVIVSGAATGATPDLAILREVRDAAGDRPVMLGSGVTPESAPALLPYADAAIVGTWIKEGGDVRAPDDVARTRTLVSACRGLFRVAT